MKLHVPVDFKYFIKEAPAVQHVEKKKKKKSWSIFSLQGIIVG